MNESAIDCFQSGCRPLAREPRDLLDNPYRFELNLKIGDLAIPVYSLVGFMQHFTVSPRLLQSGRVVYLPLANSLKELENLRILRNRAVAYGKKIEPVHCTESEDKFKVDSVLSIWNIRNRRNAEPLLEGLLRFRISLNVTGYRYGRSCDRWEFREGSRATSIGTYYPNEKCLKVAAHYIDQDIGPDGFGELPLKVDS